jgi:hypothetical protein
MMALSEADFASSLRDEAIERNADPGFRCASPWAIFELSLREWS